MADKYEIGQEITVETQVMGIPVRLDVEEPDYPTCIESCVEALGEKAIIFMCQSKIKSRNMRKAKIWYTKNAVEFYRNHIEH